jgi:hypothetical protein
MTPIDPHCRFVRDKARSLRGPHQEWMSFVLPERDASSSVMNVVHGDDLVTAVPEAGGIAGS